MAKKPSKVESPALAGPRTVCPFSGKPIQFVKTAAGWQVRGPGWVSTRFYQAEDLAQWDFSYNLGVPAGIPNPYTRVQVIGEAEPPQPSAADLVKAGEKMAEALGEEFAKDFR